MSAAFLHKPACSSMAHCFNFCLTLYIVPRKLSQYRDRLRNGRPEFDSLQGREIVLLFTECGPALRAYPAS
jgi:hypothetical protein